MSCWPVHRALCRMAAGTLSGLRIVVVFCWPVHRALCRMAATPYPAYGLWCVLLACASGVVPDGG
ncbi:TPA: hypothetical protein ACIE98_003681 [Citrobacter koseri]|uniref:hypothetical protein n=1 Tax=Citrobacter koseri TaxID=545 RepID=UPI0019006512|nr:hypothetical protein [Citrobacter koseri]EKW5655148.1 hypothetical protein [Citrobacter koseri]MBJ8987081.1 hypothetical protein [Citrobacter koseri]MBJ9009899.1 hypothetical protein [Citrobacter koseri]MBJ9282068.1 hypothetical protein [Citrobacter koseri]HAT3724216.1 hypothetical protein [Citrobacter koseri]